MHDPDPKCRHFGILWHFGIFTKKTNNKSNPIFPILSDFIRFLPIFKLFPTFRLSDSTTLVGYQENPLNCLVQNQPSNGIFEQSQVTYLNRGIIILQVSRTWSRYQETRLLSQQWCCQKNRKTTGPQSIIQMWSYIFYAQTTDITLSTRITKTKIFVEKRIHPT